MESYEENPQMRKNRLSTAILVALAFAIAVFGLGSRVANAAIQYPDIAAPLVSVDFNAGTNTFTARGTFTMGTSTNVTVMTLERTGVPLQESSWRGDFLLQAVLDSSGQLVSGSLSVTSLMHLGFPEVLPLGPILTGDVVSFSYTSVPGATTFDLDIAVTGGALQNDFPSSHATVVASAGVWSFGSGGLGPVQGTADVFAVPEPASIAIWSMIGLGCVSSVVISRKRLKVAV
jgi:hypothetical protein